MRTLVAWMMASTIMAAAYVGSHFNEINVRHEIVELEYHFRGWLPAWQMQMRAFSGSEVLLLSAVAVVFVWSAVTINK